jgi:putative ATP-dependent endonuclease of OLD family
VAVLGKSHANEARLPDHLLNLFDDYHQKFDLGSKPATHLGALAELSNDQLLDNLPDVLNRLVEHVRENLAGLPE